MRRPDDDAETTLAIACMNIRAEIIRGETVRRDLKVRVKQVLRQIASNRELMRRLERKPGPSQ